MSSRRYYQMQYKSLRQYYHVGIEYLGEALIAYRNFRFHLPKTAVNAATALADPSSCNLNAAGLVVVYPTRRQWRMNADDQTEYLPQGDIHNCE